MRAAAFALLLLSLAATDAAAKSWSPPKNLSPKWPVQFSVGKLPVQRVQESDDFVCARGQRKRTHYVYVAKATPSRVSVEAAAAAAKKKGKFGLLTSSEKEAVLERGGAISWISFSIRAMPTKLVIAPGRAVSELFYEVEIPPTNIASDRDWQKLCSEAADILDAAMD